MLLKRRIRDLSDEQPNEAIHESWMAFYVRKRKFAECTILGWQSVEYYVNQMILQESRIDLILKHRGFRTKLEFLKTMGRLSDNDRETIQRFSKERNILFHGDLSYHPSAMPKEEKTRLIELANRASQIAFNRGFKVWVDEGTGDTGNKNVPQPSRIKGVRKPNHPTKSNSEIYPSQR